MTITDRSAASIVRAEASHQVTEALTRLTTSAEPAVVFSSLAELSVGAFSDLCTVEMVEDAGAAYRISYPHSGRGARLPAMLGESVAADAIRTRIHAAAVGGQPHYAGAIVHTWHTHHPSPTDSAIAQLMVDRAVAVIAQQRLTDRRYHTNDEAASLQEALSTHRHISMAVGILVAMHDVDAQAAVAMMREQSRRTNTTLSDVANRIAAAVAATGSSTSSS